MKGIVFTEFLEMVEEKFGWDVVDDIIEASDLDSKGIYTSVGTYPHIEMIKMVSALSEETAIPIPDLLKVYGQHLFGRFKAGYGLFFENVSSSFEFLLGIENYIHIEVRKLYPEAELPTFSYEQPSPDTLILNYQSERPFADFAEGLILGCIAHFEESISIQRTDSEENPGREATFTLIRTVEEEPTKSRSADAVSAD